jgi:predicted kinase
MVIKMKSMQKVFMYVGIPGSGKSTAAKAEIAKDPDNWARINNDDIRAMLNGSVWSQDYEKFVTETRSFLTREALKRGKNVIIDNLNLNRRHFDDVVKIAKSVNGNFQVIEKAFYIELEEAIERDSKREGKAKVGEQVIRKWWKESGGKQFKFYKPRTELVQTFTYEAPVAQGPEHVPGAPEAVLCDLDGTLCLMNGRSPYDASTCDQDLPNVPVIETIKAHIAMGRKIVFCSGREDKFKPQTEEFIRKFVRVPNPNFTQDPMETEDTNVIKYELHMRKTGDFRKDAIIKQEIYDNNIKGKYNVLCVLDDRNQVVDFWRSIGLTCFQVAPGAF